MRAGKHSAQASILASSTDLTRIQTPHILFLDFIISEQIKPLQFVCHGQAAEFTFESKFEPLPGIWQSLPTRQRLFQKTIDGFDFKINGRALGAALWQSLGGTGGSDRRAQTQGISESVAVAAGLSLEEKVPQPLRYSLDRESRMFIGL